MKKTILILLLWCSSACAGVNTDGATQYLNATSVNLGLNAGTELSVCAWEKVAGPIGSQLLVVKMSDSTNQWTTFRLQPNSSGGNMAFSVQNQALGQFPNWATSGGLITAGLHQVCATFKANAFDTTDAVLYIDAVSRSTTFTANGYASGFTLEENSNDLTLGARTYTPVDSYFKGTFGDVAIWKKQLTSGEITTLYNGGFSRPCSRIPLTVQPSSLVAYFPLDDLASGTVSTTPLNLGTASISLSGTGSPTWQSALNCCNAQFNGARFNGARLNGGTCQ